MNLFIYLIIFLLKCEKSDQSNETVHSGLKSYAKIKWYDKFYALMNSYNTPLRIRYGPFPASGTPWPMPQSYQPELSQMVLRPDSLQFYATAASCDVLEMAFYRTRQHIMNERIYSPTVDSNEYALPVLKYINVTVLSSCNSDTYPHLDMKEEYKLSVNGSIATILASEVWGAVRALETFSQLVHQNPYGILVINSTVIDDFPRFPHRGILMDTARHYLQKETLFENLEAMAQNKMNVFHWHIVDDESFPYQSKVFPNLSDKGAYHHQTHVYSLTDIQEIIEQARLRGIRVIPEFDSPGHVLSWGFGQAKLLTPCYYNGQADGFFGPINPILNSTYEFLHTLFSEVLTVFKDKYLHLGGDEVPFGCWETNPDIKAMMTENGFTSVKSLLNFYETKLLNIVKNIGDTSHRDVGYIVWQEVFDNGVKLQPDAIVQVWKGGSGFTLTQATMKGFRALYSSCWYLDHIQREQDWEKYYSGCELDNFFKGRVSENAKSLVIGGDACLWMEFADDSMALSRLWPRASAAAERLWSSALVNNHVAAAPRIEEQRCRMQRRGLEVGVLGGPGGCRGLPKKPQKILTNLNSEYFEAAATSEDDTVIYVIDILKRNINMATNKEMVTGSKVYLLPAVLIMGLFICISLMKRTRGKLYAFFRIISIVVFFGLCIWMVQA